MAEGLTGREGQGEVLVRIDCLGHGNPGDVAPVGEGLSELRIDYGPGYRIYFKQDGDTATILYGGDKSSQKSDISRAKTILDDLEK